MSKELYNWLEFRFRHDNLKKYHKYFQQWVDNITENQVQGFYNQFTSFIGQDIIWKP